MDNNITLDSIVTFIFWFIFGFIIELLLLIPRGRTERMMVEACCGSAALVGHAVLVQG